MVKFSVTLCLVEEAAAGPFVFHGNLENSLASIRDLGFDAVELFAPEPGAVDVDLPGKFNLKVSAVGTGAGMVKHGLSLSDPDSAKRQRAREFIASMIEWGAQWQAPAIIGSMQGSAKNGISKETALEWLAEALDEMGQMAEEKGVPLLIEPLNRYESNLLNTLGGAMEFLRGLRTANVKILADTFHMNIEEVSLSRAIESVPGLIGHVHFVDSNRKALGQGHLDSQSVADALIKSGYSHYVSAEAFPDPHSIATAEKTITEYRRLFGRV